VWTAYRAPAVTSERLDRDVEADAAVIGAGVSGAMVAEELTDAGLSVVILDRRGPLKGSTAASTALLQYDLDTPLTELARELGEEDAMRAWRRSKLGLESLVAKTAALGVACDFARRNSLYLAGNKLGKDDLLAEQAMRNLAGLRTEYLDAPALKESYGVRREAALEVTDSVAVNPLKLAAGYLLKAAQRGAALYAPVQVESVEPGKQDVALITAEGPVVRAKHAVFATGYEIPKIVSLKGHEIFSTWAIATAPQRENLWQGKVFVWEASDPYLYVRTTKDGRVICGGEDEEFVDEARRDALIPEKTKALSAKLGKLFPRLNTAAEFAWAGCFGGTSNAMPSIGPVPGWRNCYAVLAFGGNGITFSRIAAEVIRAQINGREDPDANLFAFAKKTQV
jgi:glycine/D-amino acid oxidase-like deaminating enzyme